MGKGVFVGADTFNNQIHRFPHKPFSFGFRFSIIHLTERPPANRVPTTSGVSSLDEEPRQARKLSPEYCLFLTSGKQFTVMLNGLGLGSFEQGGKTFTGLS
jgi:hypothetical protein